MEDIQFYRIGYGNLVQMNRVLALIGPDSAPVKRIIQTAKDIGSLIDATAGHKTKTVLIMDTDHVILSAWDIDKILEESKAR